MSAQDDIFFHIKRILHVPGGMVFGNVQGFKVIIIQLYFRTFHNGKPQSGKDIANFTAHLCDGMDSSVPDAPAGKGDVNPFPEQGLIPFAGGNILEDVFDLCRQDILDFIGSLPEQGSFFRR